MHRKFCRFFVTAVMIAVCYVGSAFADVEINAANFPDDVFREYVSNNFDKDKNNFLSKEEIGKATTIYGDWHGISSLKGVEHLTALTDLSCGGNHLAELDVSKNTALTYLHCGHNQLTAIDVSNNTALIGLYCSSNQLTELDVSKNIALLQLYCDGNQFTELDVSKNTDLTGLWCGGNPLTELDLSKNIALTELYFWATQLTELDLSNNTALTVLYCGGNQLATLDLSNNTALSDVDCNPQRIYGFNLNETGNPSYPYQFTFTDVMSPDKTANVSDVKGLDSTGTEITTSYANGIALFASKPSKVTYFYNTGYGDMKMDVIVSDKAENVKIDAKNFPDANFRSYVSNYFDWDKDGMLSATEIENATSIYLRENGNVSTLKGIEYFTALTWLECACNELTTLDMSKNTALTVLDCGYNQLTTLDVSNNTALTQLQCNNNQLTTLDVSNNTALTRLECEKNQLTILDVSNNTALTELWCLNNQLAFLDLSNNTELQNVYCYSQRIYGLNLTETGNPSYPYQFSFTDVMSPDKIANVSDVKGLNSAGTEITTSYMNGIALFASKPSKVTYNYNTGYGDMKMDVTVSNIPVTVKIDAENFPDENFRSYVSNNFDWDRDGILSEEEIANATIMEVTSKNISTLKGIEYFIALTILDCGENQLTELDLSKNTALKYLTCPGNKLTELDLRTNTALTSVTCVNNQLTALNVRENTALEYLSCADNKLTTLDVSNNTALITLFCSNNQLTAIDVSNNTALTKLHCEENQLTTLDVSNNIALTELWCWNNQLTTLDLSKNTALIKLYCYDNQLTELDVSKNTALTQLYCSGNKITVLDVRSCPKVYINCDEGVKVIRSDAAKPEITTETTTRTIPTDTPFYLQLEASGTTPITWSKTGTLPTGLNLSSSGLISGTPKSAQTKTFKVTAKNKYGNDTKSFTITTYVPVSITTAKLADGTTDKTYSAVLKAKGSNVTWSATGLPDGFTINAKTGKISGKTSSYGDYSVVVRAENSLTNEEKTFTLKIKGVAPTISGTLKTPELNKSYSSAFTVKGTSPIEWSISGNLPDGLTFDTSTGTISGTPKSYSKAGYKVTITATGPGGSKSKTVTLKVKGTAPTFSGTLKQPEINKAYSSGFTVKGSDTIALSMSGELPDGLTFDSSTGIISGTPKSYQKSGYKITITATNPVGSTSKTVTLKIKGTAPTFSGTLKQPELNKSYSSGFTVKGSDTITLSMSGELPDGLTFDKETGIISGTPKSYQKSGFKITITATNPVGSKSKTVTLKVKGTAPTFSGTLKQPEIYKEYSSGFTVKGSDTITLSMSGKLPDGLTFNEETGVISGTPTSYSKSGYKITITATNPVGSKSKTVTLKVKATAPTISGTLKQPEINKAYSSGLTAKGTQPIKWSISGNLPDGLTFDTSTGVISGTPTSYLKAGYKITITATNIAGSKSKTVTLKVKGTAPVIKTTKLPNATQWSSYSVELNATGSDTITWRADGLPDGLSLNGNVIEGTPTVSGNKSVTIYAKNPVSEVKKKLTLKIVAAEKAETNDDTKSPKDTQTTPSDPDDEESDTPEAPEEEATESPQDDEEDTAHSEGEYVIVAELGEISRDVEGLYDFSVVLSDDAVAGAELVYIANSSEPSSDDEIAEFFDETGKETSEVPESRHITISIWLNKEVIYNPAVGIRK